MLKWIVLFLIIGFVVLSFYYCSNKELEVDNGELIIESEELKIEKLDSVSIVDIVDSIKSIDSNISVAKKPAKLQLEMLDVEHGLAVLIQAPKCAVMYDVGKRRDIDTILKNKNIKRLCSVILSHWHSDHAKKLLVLMKMVKNEELKIDSLFVSYDYPLKGKPAKWRKEFEDLNEDIKIPISKKHRGDTIWDFAPFTAKVLWPMQNSPSDTGDAASMVVHLVGGEKSFLFMGDLYSAQEKELLKLDKNLETHALQVGHHGSKSSSSKRFLEQLNPQKAYISTGKCYHILHKDSTKNCYGLPNDEAIKRLRDIIPDSNIFRTDKFGSVGFEMEF